MFRSSILTVILCLALLGCAPGGSLGSPSNSQCRLSLADHCTDVCTAQDSLTVGYIAAIEVNQFRCVCKRPEDEKPGFAF